MPDVKYFAERLKMKGLPVNVIGINMSKADKTVFEFLEAAELAYLGWGNSVQKANRLYNRHLSEEIKSRLINIRD